MKQSLQNKGLEEHSRFILSFPKYFAIGLNPSCKMF